MKTTDAIISHVLTELDVSCLPKDLPEFIEVDLSPLAVGQSIHVSDLKLPAGVTAVTRAGASPVVATAIVPRIVVEVEEVVAPTAEAVPGEAAPVEGAKPGDKAAEKGGEKPAEKGADKAPCQEGRQEISAWRTRKARRRFSRRAFLLSRRRPSRNLS